MKKIQITLLSSLGLLCMAACGAVQSLSYKTDKIGTKEMNKDQKEVIELLALQDDEYFAFNDQSHSKLSAKLTDILEENPLAVPPTEKISAERPPLVAIGAPKAIEVDKQDEFPLLMAIRTTGLRDWRVDFDQNARILLVDLDTGVIRSERLVGSHKRGLTPLPSMSQERPDELNAATVSIGLNKLRGLRKSLGIDWRPGRYAVTVIIYDWISNTVVVELKGKDEKRPARWPQEASSFLSSTSIMKETPKIDVLGMSLSAPEEVDLGAPVPIYGAVHIPFDKAIVAACKKSDSETKTPDKSWLLIASVILVKLDAEDPEQIGMVIPATVSGDPGSGQILQGYFSLDIRTALSGRNLSGKHQLYLVAGDKVAGPYPSRLGGL